MHPRHPRSENCLQITKTDKSIQAATPKKELSERVHPCDECGYVPVRDVAAAQVVMQRGVVAVGHN
ncbi:hypothetical protein BST81_13385 [Leptolyngbya sp. 'hensonii']|nr:hypothetical protein BST81_13385 [Leptolyngbya sp. 'hensonii']